MLETEPERNNHFPRILEALLQIKIEYTLVVECVSRFVSLRGLAALSCREAPAIPQASEFKSQRKLDLPLVIL